MPLHLDPDNTEIEFATLVSEGQNVSILRPLVRSTRRDGPLGSKTVTYFAPNAGFGNRILSYLSIASVAYSLGVRLRLAGAREVERPLLRGSSGALGPFYGTTILGPSADVGGLVARLQEVLKAGPRVWVNGPLLGDAWVRVASAPPNRLIEVEARICAERAAVSTSGSVVMHFRGGDFAEWNSQAILSTEYYMLALEYVRTAYPDVPVLIATDDWNLESAQSLFSHLTQFEQRLSRHVCSKGLLCDFALLRNAHVIVSSPSTFAVSASLLGSSRSIHSRDWVEERARLGDQFWVALLSNAVPYHRCKALI